MPRQKSIWALDTFIAGLGIPLRWVLLKLDDAKQMRLVQAAYDELQKTGKVEKNLNEDDREVRFLHQKEIVERRYIRKDETAIRKTIATRKTVHVEKSEKLPTFQPTTNEAPTAQTVSTKAPSSTQTAAPIKNEASKNSSAPKRAPRFYLELEDEIEKAPSIGKKNRSATGTYRHSQSGRSVVEQCR